jgi:type II secretory ATPase GspE/PulE/Tfp pilus assembly ATPase PilB-like protein
MAEQKKPLGARLVENSIISEDQLRIALLEQKKNNMQLGKLLVSMGFVTDAALRETLSENLGRESVDLGQMVADRMALKLIPKDLATRYKLLPVTYDPETRKLILAMSDPNNVVALDQIRALLKGEAQLQPMFAGETEVVKAIEQYYGFELSIDGILHEIETGEIDYQSLQVTSDEYSQPVVRLIDALLADAVQQGSSDIHFEPEANFLRIRYRIDGVLRQVRSLHRNYWPAMVVRLKVMSGMNIAESRSPQDGRISLHLFGRPVDFRVATQPVTYGENVVLRILDRQKGIVPVDKLGLYDDALDLLKLMLARPEGIILVTGPTGSGKTTTLYSILNHINNEGINIMTLEDPVEYPMNMIRQTSVNEAAKMDFASGIRSMMRQDPDVILVGEIRDAETAEMAFRAAMTGHQVYSTLHTNSAIGSIPRLLDIGIEPEILSGNIIGIIAQRLVRKLCKHCKQAHQADDLEKKLLGVDKQNEYTIHDAVGCEQCSYQGYRGRISILELFMLDPDLDELIAKRATARELTNMAFSKGFRPLIEDATRRVLDGTTSLDEISRVVDLTSRLR